MQRDGWVPAGQLKPGDLLSTLDGNWLPVERVEETGEWTTVYNFRVADYHTYFAGPADGAFALWVHNSYSVHLNSNDATSEFGIYDIEVDNELYKVGKADLARITQSTDLPTRLHQQLRILREIYGEANVTGEVVQELGTITTQEAKMAETARLQDIFNETGIVPPGNIKSFKPPL